VPDEPLANGVDRRLRGDGREDGVAVEDGKVAHGDAAYGYVRRFRGVQVR
jgi:hypothetical protein